MEELLPYYERELGFLRGSSRDFAQRYPKIAARRKSMVTSSKVVPPEACW